MSGRGLDRRLGAMALGQFAVVATLGGALTLQAGAAHGDWRAVLGVVALGCAMSAAFGAGAIVLAASHTRHLLGTAYSIAAGEQAPPSVEGADTADERAAVGLGTWLAEAMRAAQIAGRDRDHAEAALQAGMAAQAAQLRGTRSDADHLAGTVSAAAARLPRLADQTTADRLATLDELMSVSPNEDRDGTLVAEIETELATLAAAAAETTQGIAAIGATLRALEPAVTQAKAAAHALAQGADRQAAAVRQVTEIAHQGHLLALNAAETAPDAAVTSVETIAAEIKFLAVRTAAAAGAIARDGANSDALAAQMAQAVGQIGQALSSLDQLATTMADAVMAQGGAVMSIGERVTAGGGHNAVHAMISTLTADMARSGSRTEVVENSLV